MKTKDLLSKKRQKLSQEHKRWSTMAKSMETKPYLFENEHTDNLRKAAFSRAEAQRCLADLAQLRSGSKAQKLAGFTQNYT